MIPKYNIGDIMMFGNKHYLILDIWTLYSTNDRYAYLELESGNIKPGMVHYVDANSKLVA